MIHKQRSEAIKRHHAHLNQLLHSIVKELKALDELGNGESDWNEADGTISYLYQDVSLLKYFRQRYVQSCTPDSTEDRSAQSECRTPFHIQPRKEWKVKICDTPSDSFYEFRILRLNGAIEETSIHEYETSAAPTDNEK